MGDGGDGVEALIGKNTGVFWELGSLMSAGHSNGGFFGLAWGTEV